MATPDPRTYRISHVRRATASTRVVSIDLAGTPFRYVAGQVVQVGIPGEREMVPYSIASAPEETAQTGSIELLVKVEPSGKWGHRFSRLARGMRVTLRGPSGVFTFPPHPRERRFLFIAGGTGIAPIRSMLKHLELGSVAGRSRLLYSAKTSQDFAFLPELRGLARRTNMDLALTATREVGDRWRGGRGRIAASRLAALVDDPETLCFVCGPQSMVKDVPLMLVDLGIAKSRIRLEEW
jgi:ferredoxin-NADP reductase